MGTSIQVLILEHRPEDADLMAHELRRSGLDAHCQRVETEPDFLAHLEPPPDVILADYSLPQMDASGALRLLQERDLDIPFLLVSGTIDERRAVAILRHGATDYLMKDRLARLGPAVEQALAQRKLRREKRAAAEALRSSENRFFAFMSHSPAVALIKDEDGRLLYLNNAAASMWHQDPADWLGKLDRGRWPAETADRLRAHDLEVLRSGQPSQLVEEMPGDPTSYRLAVRFPFADTAGRRLLGTLAFDISEQKRAEAQLSAALAAREVLLQEVHHRVKNNLHVISSLLHLQAQALRDPAAAQALEAAQQRVQSMALVHEGLYGGEGPGRLDLRKYVERLTTDLVNSYSTHTGQVRLRLDLAPLSLDLDQAIPCGLILNELITNALRHAFPAGRTGEILVALTPQDGHVSLRVADTGIGLPPDFDWKESKSLGLRIIDILTRQLDGTLSQAPGAGADFMVTFPYRAEPAASLARGAP